MAIRTKDLPVATTIEDDDEILIDGPDGTRSITWAALKTLLLSELPVCIGGNGDPEGVVEGVLNQIYTNRLTGDIFKKTIDGGTTGWI